MVRCSISEHKQVFLLYLPNVGRPIWQWLWQNCSLQCLANAILKCMFTMDVRNPLNQIHTGDQVQAMQELISQKCIGIRSVQTQCSENVRYCGRRGFHGTFTPQPPLSWCIGWDRSEQTMAIGCCVLLSGHTVIWSKGCGLRSWSSVCSSPLLGFRLPP